MLFNSFSTCPVCSSTGVFWCKAKDWEYRTSEESYIYLRCQSCSTLFIREFPGENLSSIYPPDYYSFSKKPARIIFKLKNLWDVRFYKKLLKNTLSTSLSVLDIGGGSGEVLDVLKKAEKRIVYTEIVDIDKTAGEEARKKGHIYSLSTVEAYDTERKFDLILLLNIIEHVSDPFYLIKKAGNMLLPGGKIVIKTPNMDSLDARIFRNYYWGGLHCPRHWIIFSDQSFRKMMESSDLTVEKISFTQGAPFWSFSVLQLFRDKRISQKKKPLIEHPLFGILSILFAMIDISRAPFSKTSQMFIIIRN